MFKNNQALHGTRELSSLHTGAITTILAAALTVQLSVLVTVNFTKAAECSSACTPEILPRLRCMWAAQPHCCPCCPQTTCIPLRIATPCPSSCMTWADPDAQVNAHPCPAHLSKRFLSPSLHHSALHSPPACPPAHPNQWSLSLPPCSPMLTHAHPHHCAPVSHTNFALSLPPSLRLPVHGQECHAPLARGTSAAVGVLAKPAVKREHQV